MFFKKYKQLIVGISIGAIVAGSSAAFANSGLSQYVTLAFTNENQHPDKTLESVINSAHKSLDIAIYSITYPDIVNSIVNAKKRGIAVRIITDKTEAGNQYQKNALNTLKKAGIPIKENSHSGIMHLKVTIVDQSTVTTGSFNYTKAASTTNDEVLVKIQDSAIAKQFENEFNSMWNDTKGFKTY